MLRLTPTLLFVVALLALASLGNAERCREGCVSDSDYKVCQGGKSRRYKCPGALVCRNGKGGSSSNVHCAGRRLGKSSSTNVRVAPTTISNRKQRVQWNPTTNRRSRPTTTKQAYKPDPTTRRKSQPTTTRQAYNPDTTRRTSQQAQPTTTRSGGGGGGTFSGEGTYYDVGIGSCGDVNSNSEFVAALNGGQMGNGANPNNNPNCGRKIKVNGPLGSVTVTIVDTCPPCAYGDVDLSPTAFEKIAKKIDGRVPITWSWA